MLLFAISTLAGWTEDTMPAASGQLTLHYDCPAQYYEEALPIGNGNIGATIYGGSDREQIQLNDITLWTGEPESGVFAADAYKALPAIREALFREGYPTAERLMKEQQGHYSENYQPVGDLFIDFDGASTVSDYHRWLDIGDATAHNNYRRNGRSVTTDYFASAPDSLIVVRLQSETPLTCRLRFDSPLPITTSAADGMMTVDGYAAYHSYPNYLNKLTQKHFYDPLRGIHFRTLVRIVPTNGTVSSETDGWLVLKDCTEALFLIVNVTSFNGFDKDPVTEGRDYKQLAAQRMERAMRMTYDELLARHIADYQTYFSRVELDLGTTSPEIAALPTDRQLLRYTELGEPNPDLEELYFQYARYLLISCSRTKAVPANLQGLWNKWLLPPWSCNYTSNINLEENYWLAEVTNLSEMHMPLMDFVSALSLSGQQTAKAYYGVLRGWCLGHNTDIWAMSNPVGEHDGGIMWANWNMGGAWIATHIWEHYLFTRDRHFLASYYPYLRGAAEFCIDWLTEKDGYLLTAPSTSPENTYITPDGYRGAGFYGGSADIGMIRECLTDAIAAAQVLGCDNDLQQEMLQTVGRLLPYRIDSDGKLQEWYHDWRDHEPTHRHQSHLFGLYPGHHITLDDTPRLAQAAARTLELKGMKTTGWSAGWRVNLYARLRDTERAYSMLQKLLSYVSPDEYQGDNARRGGGTYPNLWDAHAPFQIDGNFGGCAGMAEMLLQSTPTDIHLLPCLPAAWSCGSFRGLCARGGFVVDLTWRNRRVTSLTITARADATTTVHANGMQQTVSLKAGESKVLSFS